MDAGDYLARIAEGQVGTRSDLHSGRASLYGYLLATDASLAAFEPEWARTGFGSDIASRYHLLNSGGAGSASRFRLLDTQPSPPDFQAIMRIHSWCAAFVDWCVMRLLMESPHATSLPLGMRPKTASAFGLLKWGKNSNCTVFDGNHSAPVRGDIAVFNFSHTGIVVQSGVGHFYSVEGNTTPGTGGNQGYLVARRMRAQVLLRGIVRLPPRDRLGDYNISSRIAHTA
ncbi:MAG: peptidoglycan binding domain protein [Gemmatimonadetes bacterium]|nr:peptidoglycan binding domain protein [Gemmatimonadota bacterium]